MSLTNPPLGPRGSGFLDPAAPTLTTVLEQLATAEPEQRRRGEMVSAVRTFCRVLGRLPHELPADTALLNRLQHKALPAAAGVAPARWANVRSLVLRAMQRTGCQIMPGRRLHSLAPAWAALDDRLPDRYARASLSRLMRWCSAEGIAPADVDQAVSERFGQALLEDSFHAHPRDAWQRTVNAWNRAATTVPGWPSQQLTPPPRERPSYVLPLTDFPAAFQADVQRWLDQLAGLGGLDVGPVQPLRPATLAKWKFTIRQMAAALIAGGYPLVRLTGLADLVTVEAAETILRFFLTRAGNKPCAQTQGIAARLKAIAEHHAKVAPKVMERLQRMAQRATPSSQGMTDKNRDMLRQFADLGMQRRLINLPAELFARLPSQGPLPQRCALRLQSALAVEILLVAPMRLKNLASLELDRHLQRSGRGRHARWFVVIPAAEVKNDTAIELPLPTRTAERLETYRTRVLPDLGAGLWLFPGENGPKREVSLGPQIGKFIQRELGCRISPHQFRHLCGYLYLQHNPDGYEVVRAMLGHVSIGTTMRFYAGLEGITAARHYDAMLQELVSSAPKPRRRR